MASDIHIHQPVSYMGGAGLRTGQVRLYHIQVTAMTDFYMIVDFWARLATQMWKVVTDWWFISLPLFALFLVNILKLLWSIAPGNSNRKH